MTHSPGRIHYSRELDSVEGVCYDVTHSPGRIHYSREFLGGELVGGAGGIQ